MCSRNAPENINVVVINCFILSFSCAFGYAGFNCNDSALLAVVIISCVLGALLIIVLALLIYCYCRRFTRSKQDYSSSPYSSGDLNKPWPTVIPPIPRASMNLEAAPPIEMSEGGSTRVLVDNNHPTNGLVSYYIVLCRLRPLKS
ncbi:Protein HEG [Liparis tanakae]|uniref:Protein HEG n=1 Tax=Liparis tanakae TaxID=230148 RepID=A0A4Z2EES6_9TELE|nr:Protein HEG [Liparis tanakae]